MPTAFSFSQTAGYSDTFLIGGNNDEDIFRYATYYIDSSASMDVGHADSAFRKGGFRRWPLGNRFNMGLNPCPLWLHLNLKNTNTHYQTYWWSFYTSSDTVLAFEKRNGSGWDRTDLRAGPKPFSQRKKQLRFPLSEIGTEAGEPVELLIKLRDLHSVQSFFTDLTTPEDNLRWENGFHLKTGIVIGSFLLFVFFTAGFALLLRQMDFVYYSLYILLAIAMLLKEELLSGILGQGVLSEWLDKLHGLPLSIVGMGLHYKTMAALFPKKHPGHQKPLSWLDRANRSCLGTGLIGLAVVFAFYDRLALTEPRLYGYWYTGIGILALMSLNLLAMLGLHAAGLAAMLKNLALGLLFVIFSIPSFYVNYTGIVSIYPITYPNYYYEIVLLQLLNIAILIVLQYKGILNQNLRLLQEKIDLRAGLQKRVSEAQAEERKNISRDLHDDLGGTLSTIHLLVTHQFPKEKKLIDLIKKSCDDVRMFSRKLSKTEPPGDAPTLKSQLNDLLQVLNSVGRTAFELITIGEETQLPIEHRPDVAMICNELLNNIQKHAQARTALLQLIFEAGMLTLMAEDDGIGFDPEKTFAGNGLSNIRERTEKLMAKLHVSSGSKGTTVIVEIPLTSPENHFTNELNHHR